MQIPRNKNGNFTPSSLSVSFQQFDAFCKAEITFFIGRAFINVSKFRCCSHMTYHITTSEHLSLYCRLEMMREEFRFVFRLAVFFHAYYLHVHVGQIFGCWKSIHWIMRHCALAPGVQIFLSSKMKRTSHFFTRQNARDHYLLCASVRSDDGNVVCFNGWFGATFISLYGYSQVPKQFALKRILIVCCWCWYTVCLFSFFFISRTPRTFTAFVSQ